MYISRLYVLGLLLLSDIAIAQQGKRIVVYVDEVQEERRSTRWTLTEWLRIKERMKLMDVWLAMFSDPKKDKFAPELSFSYGRAGGDSHFHLGSLTNFDSDKQTREGEHTGEEGRVQFWFTNLISSTTGLRTLAIDLGLEGRVVNRFMGSNLSLDGSDAFASDTDKLQQGGVNLRIFGANVQDSSLVAKIGQYQRSSGFIAEGFQESTGTYYGGEMQLYFLSWLGAEGNYYAYKGKGDPKAEGSSFDYFGFLEIYNVRLGYGAYGREWSTETVLQKLDSTEEGASFLVRFYL